MSATDNYDAFKEKLDAEHNWPAVYMFKFVVPSLKAIEFEAILPEQKFTVKKSKGGKYISFTLKKMITNSQEVVDIYQAVSGVEGLIAL